LSSTHLILKQFWNYDSFRPLQEEIIDSVLNGKDVLALLPTGGGKSLCYQIPALAKEGMCLVISPLIALMKDQVENLRRKNITAFAIFSGMSRKEVANTLQVAASSNCKFLYVSPERLETNLFKEYLPSLDVNLIAVDEAHCISQWGFDFRPPYLRIAALRDELEGIPVLAVTASATKEVQLDICERLKFKRQLIFQPSFERPNLSYSVFPVESKVNKIKEIIHKISGTGIVYCKTRKRTKEISDLLNLDGFVAAYYHAGINPGERARIQDAWMKNKTRIIVCTNAFGMGIDKPDVRTVIHADGPDCLENYYQEAGRAGRDGEKSYAVLLYNERDIKDLNGLSGIRFPGVENIKLVYQSLMNYLQIPAGSGEGNYYDFEMADFTKKFKLGTNLVQYSLKALVQEGWLSFNEQVFLPSKITFTVGKPQLVQFEKDNPKLEVLTQVLLRGYPGIFDQLVAVHERKIAWLLQKDEMALVNDLRSLHAFGIIEYIGQKDSPQLYCIQDRVRAEDMRINQTNYQKRKEQFEKRIENFLLYLKAEKDCRSQMIASYFGDADAGSVIIVFDKRTFPDSPKSHYPEKKRVLYLLTENELDKYIYLELILPPSGGLLDCSNRRKFLLPSSGQDFF
jgi:ATP-dependent DNA helicase RecQ